MKTLETILSIAKLRSDVDLIMKGKLNMKWHERGLSKVEVLTKEHRLLDSAKISIAINDVLLPLTSTSEKLGLAKCNLQKHQHYLVLLVKLRESSAEARR